ncbi:MAG: autotransporter domain-containing protein [Reyranella sp.]|nr:autotransporter domain-containing protein [Reyranella sp.]
MAAWMEALDRVWRCLGASGRCTALSVPVWAAAALFAGSAIAQVICSGLTATQCTQATGQYQILQSFQALPTTPAGQNALQADLSTVVGIYQNATLAQRNQAVLNSDDVTYTTNHVADSYNPTAQFNVWQQISSTSQILPTLSIYPQLQISSALANTLSSRLNDQVKRFDNGEATASISNAITELLLGDGSGNTSSISAVQQVGPLKDTFTAYETNYPYSNPANRTPYSLPPCPNSGNPCQSDPRPYQLTTQISPWQSGQATAADISSQAEQWRLNQTSGAFPSGHSTYGNTTALLYAIMLPQAYQSMMVSGQQFGLSRNILGVHHTLDIIGGRMLAYYTMTQLLAGNSDYLLSNVPTFTGIATYTNFSAYVMELSAKLQADLGAAYTAVPYASCASNVAGCIAGGVFPSASQFAAANQAYADLATYGLPSVSTTNLAAVVPANAELLLKSRFPYLSDAQIREVLATTELPSGGPLDDGSGWVRLNLFKAAGGYGAFNSNVSVTLDRSSGFNAVDMWSNDISGTGGLTKFGAGLLILGGTNSYTGGTTVKAGTLALSGTMVGDLTIDAGASFVSGGGYSVASGATLTNAGTFQSVNGSLVNQGTINNSGSLLGGLVNYGTFRQTGSAYANSSILINNATFTGNVNNTGTLGGNGTFNGVVTNQNVLAPGNSIGTLTVNGSFTQAAGGSYRVETNAAGQADRLNLTGAPGTATLNGGTVAVVEASGVYAPSTTYTILNAAGGVTGTFTGITSAFPFLQGSLAYNANNVFLTLKPGGFAAGAATANQAAVGAALDQSVAGASGDFATVVGTLATANLAQGQAAMNAVSGQNYAGFSTANIGGGLLFMNAVSQQLAAARGGDPGKGTRVALAEACEIESCGPSPWSLWGTGLAGFGSVAGNANAGTVTYSAGGAATGIDYRLSPNLLVGLGAGFASGSQWVNGLSGRGTTDAYQASLYASFTEGGFWADGLVGYAYNDNRMTRQIAIQGLRPRNASGSTGANQFLAQVEAGFRFGLYAPAAATIAPFARLQGATVMQNGFTESGAGSLNLAVASQTTNALRSTLGVEFNAGVAVGTDHRIGLMFRLGWAHEFADTTRPVTASFSAAPGSGFTVLGAEPARDAAVLALAADTAVAGATSLYLRYDGEVGGGSDAHAITAGIRMTW